MEEIVIDTNVLAHAENDIEGRKLAAIELIAEMHRASTVLCLDMGFNLVEASNRSAIAAEYFEHLRFGTLGFALIVALGTAGRIRELPKRPADRAKARRINQLVRKPSDRVFLGVACNLTDGVLVSHDFEDFQQDKRRTIRSELDVRVLEAAEALGKLRG